MAHAPRQLGRTGPTVFPLALGCMGMSAMYGPADEAESVATIRAAVDLGITLFDTGDFYGVGHNERLLQRALGNRRKDVLLSVKFGALRAPGGGWTGFDGRPVAVKNALAYSLDRLGTEYVDVYRPGRLDPAVPIEETMGALAELVKGGFVRHIGLSEVNATTVRRASAVHPVVDVQLEYSLISRGLEADLPALRALGVGVTAYGVLSRGLLTGSAPKGPTDYRAWLPRFSGDNAAVNAAAHRTLAGLAERRGVTPAQLAIAWVLARGADVVPVIGARTRAQLVDAVKALDLELSPAELASLEQAVTPGLVAGARYDAGQMAMLDSEKRA
ncbi:MAG: aldo/keto reductase [Myxococcaceae bacterium]|jgi:aryl-alcohol dehydrogenase-like predicted oxidoreductase|nr:aldo/keto reductase [Myxococcaceae bacterium]MCA3015408.1 aldo/keto reductase [Myxococcaceae bacterium]